MADQAGGAQPARVVLIADDQRAAMSIIEMLRAAWPHGLLITQATGIADAVHELSDHGDACVLLDLPADSARPPDLPGLLAPLQQLDAAAPGAPVIVVSDHGDDLGVATVQAGAQDHLLRSELNPPLLQRAVRYAIERKRSEVELTRQALHDPLTALPNRTLFLDRLSVALDRSRRIGLPVAVLFLDVDDFKEVNDSLGHAAGDVLLTVLADRFSGLLRPMDTVARFGGDEFTFLFEGLEGEREATLIAERITDAAGQPLSLGRGGREATVAVSIGIALLQDPAIAPEDAIRDADAAMYRAKELGGARFELFDERARRRVAQRTSLQDALRAAIESRQLRVLYQPRVSLNSETGLVGFEALVRWEHPERGLIAPAEFMGIAEETGLIVPIGDWVIEQALAQVRRWRQSRPGMTISVNLSGRQLRDPRLVARLSDAMRSTGADPSMLWVEVAEELVEREAEPAAQALEALRRIGVRLAIDEFGMGRSSLQSLRRLPVEMLKIHRSFVSSLGSAPNELALVGALVELGHALGLSVTAEGVETDAQLARLRELGCDGAQGYLFSQPVTEDGVHDLLGGA